MVNQSSILGKTLTISVILLFIGVGIQPAIATVEPDNSNLEEITIQFYETDRTYEHTVMLTRKQIKELENLFNDFNIKIDNADNRLETESIYKDTVLSLNDIGILPKDMSIDKAQRLVTGKEHNPLVIRILERLYDGNKGSWEDDENFLCLISGSTDYYTSFIGPIGWSILHFLNILVNLYYKSYYNYFFLFLIEIFSIFFIPILFLGSYIWQYTPLPLGHYIELGITFYNSSSGYLESEPATGLVHTRGLNGEKIWNGSFYGILPILNNMEWHIGVIGFTGIKILLNDSINYLGSALWVKIRNTWW